MGIFGVMKQQEWLELGKAWGFWLAADPHSLILSIRGFGGKGHFTSSKQTMVYQRAGESQCWYQPRILTLKELCALFREQLPYLTLKISLIWTVWCSTLFINCKSLHFLLTHVITKDILKFNHIFFPLTDLQMWNEQI